MRLFFNYLSALLATVILLCPACEQTPNGGVDEKTTVTILATLENGREWKAGDEVSINNVKYVVETGGSSTVSIEDVAAADYYYAAYDFGNGTIEGTNLSLEIPALQSPAISMIQPMVRITFQWPVLLLFQSILSLI